MGISLKVIELFNIRSHKHFKFVPADSGVTAISGPTGSGKSTVIDSLAWILFGTKPQGVAKNAAIIREGTELKDEKVSAYAELMVDGYLVKVERRIVTKAGGVKCDIWEWDSEASDWDHKAGDSPSHAETYIRQRLKMDEQGFLTAVLVQQKQVDKLISAGAPERAKIIEKLTGIASISSAISAAKKDRDGFKKALELTSVDETELETVESDLLVAETEIGDLREGYRIAREKLQGVQAELKSFEADVDAQAESFERAEKARAVLTEVEVKLEAADSILTDTKTERDEAKALLPQGSRGVTFAESLAELKGLRSQVSTLESSKLYHERIMADAALKIRELKGLIEDSDFDSADALSSASDELLSEIETIGKKLRKITDASGELRGELSQIESAIEIVSHGEDCPTCRQSVADVSGAVKALESQRDEIRSKLTKLEAKSNKLTADREIKRAQSKSFASLSESYEELESLAKRAESSEEELAGVTSELKAKSAELKGAEKLHKVVEREEENAKRYASALQRLQKVIQTIESLKGKRSAAKETLKETKAPSETKLNSLRKKLYSLQVSYQDGRVALNEQKTEAKILTSSIEHLTEKRAIYKKELERHKELLRSVEVAAATMATLVEFRTDRVKTALPTIESYASELLSRFTDGKFIALKLDEKFNASVILSSGVERAVGMLSGGELSAAAIALRLSVSMMLNASDSSNLIILDEVLVSQDADRSELILSTIKDVCKGQVVMISHGAGVASIADKRVDLAGS